MNAPRTPSSGTSRSSARPRRNPAPDLNLRLGPAPGFKSEARSTHVRTAEPKGTEARAVDRRGRARARAARWRHGVGQRVRAPAPDRARPCRPGARADSGRPSGAPYLDRPPTGRCGACGGRHAPRCGGAGEGRQPGIALTHHSENPVAAASEKTLPPRSDRRGEGVRQTSGSETPRGAESRRATTLTRFLG